MFGNREFRVKLAMVALALCAAAASAQASDPAHMDWGRSIVANVLPANNSYGTDPNYIHWAGVDGYTVYENRTQCSSFATRVFKQAYGWSDAYYKTWTGSTSPTAAQYHDLVAAQKGFQPIVGVADIRPGDLIAIKYPAGSSSTGHVMLVNAVPVLRASTSPIIPYTSQYAVQVIDSSQSGHGPTDTRLQDDGSFHDGVGIGILRLYTDGTDSIVGYSWSTVSNSVYYDQSTRNLVVGRLF